MAPTVRASTSTRGKTRIYLCRACGLRHVSPTGANCPHTKRPIPVAPKTIAKRRGRPPLTRLAASPSSVSSDFTLPLSGVVRRIDSAQTPGESSSDDDVELEDLLRSSQAPNRRAGAPDTQMSPRPVQEEETGRPPVPTPRGSVLRHQATEPTDADVSVMLLEQIQAMREESCRDLQRVERQAQADRRAMETSIRQLSAQMAHVQATPVPSFSTPANLGPWIRSGGGGRPDM